VPASITHAVVGEYVRRELFPLLSIDNRGSFYGGCILIDVHAFNNIDRQITHFVGTIEEDRQNTYLKSCNKFIKDYKNLISSPEGNIGIYEKYFIAGYLCHLAADETWRKWGLQIYRELGLNSWSEFPVLGDYGLATFDFLSNQLFSNKEEFIKEIDSLHIPNIFNHIPYPYFQKQWYVCKDYVYSDGSIEPYVEALGRAGKTAKEIENIKSACIDNWGRAIEFYVRMGGAKNYILSSMTRSIEVLNQLELW
jgi:hypothetical protein